MAAGSNKMQPRLLLPRGVFATAHGQFRSSESTRNVIHGMVTQSLDTQFACLGHVRARTTLHGHVR